MSGTLQAQRNRVALSNASGLEFTKWDRLDHALAFAAERPIEDTLLDKATQAKVRAIGCQTASEAALCLLLDSTDETMKAKALGLMVSRLPKVVEHRSINVSLKDMDLADLIEAATATPVEQAKEPYKEHAREG